MKGFVLDNSVAMRWLLTSEKRSDQVYAERVLKSLVETTAFVPSLWHLEAANVLRGAERNQQVEPGEVEHFIAQLEQLPIQVDLMTPHKAFSRTLVLARAYNLSTYDAAYLELALREGLPLATLDKDLKKAAIKAQVEIF